jgi:hypothetical protein
MCVLTRLRKANMSYASMNGTPRYIRLVVILPALLAALGTTADAYSQNDRPEPMVFDLVDPLGAPKGETEINTLLDYSPSAGKLQWSPELEYAFAKGHAIEFELPLENTTVNQYKVTLQGYFGELMNGRMLHGWQAGGRRINEEKVYAAEVLYLNDYKFSDKWSMMNMLGVRHTAIGKSSGEFIGLLNNSVFYSFTTHFSVGVELNSEIGERQYRYRLTPQIQYSYGKDVIIQLGGGPSQLTTRWDEEKKTEWLVTSRLIYDF